MINMTLEYLRKEDHLGLVFSRGNKLLQLAMKVKVIGTIGKEGLGMIRTINFHDGTQFVDIVWLEPMGYELKPGQKVKFTKE